MGYRSPRILALASAVAALALAGAAVAQSSTDDPRDEAAGVALALQANDTLHEYCAELYASDVQQAVESYARVGEAWGAVDARLAETGEPYWRYWRGLLAECLGQYDQASGDLEAFLTEHGDGPVYRDLARDARRRLRRLTDLNEGRSSARIGKRRTPIAFLADPRAAETLRGIDLIRYRRSGLTFDQWQAHRFSNKLRVMLMWSWGAESGPMTAVIHEVVVPGDAGQYRAAALTNAWHFRSAFAIEVWPAEVFSVGWMLGFHRTAEQVGYVHASSFDDVTGVPESYDFVSDDEIMVDTRIWTGFTFLPLRRFKPLIRLPVVGLKLRPESDNVSAGGEYTVPLFLAVGVGGFAGVGVRLATILELEAGVWFLVDLTDNEVVDTKFEASEVEHLSYLQPAGGRFSARPSLALKLIL